MYTDLHAHILPGVDDGAKKLEDSIHMARVAAEHGTDVILATPHRKDVTENYSVPHIRGLTASLNLNPNPPKDTDGRREDSGRGWVRELQGRWPGVLG